WVGDEMEGSGSGGGAELAVLELYAGAVVAVLGEDRSLGIPGGCLKNQPTLVLVLHRLSVTPVGGVPPARPAACPRRHRAGRPVPPSRDVTVVALSNSPVRADRGFRLCRSGDGHRVYHFPSWGHRTG